jgi:voltage-gated potassium channel
MTKQLLLALLLTSVTVPIHAVGIVYVVMPLAGVNRRDDKLKTGTPILQLTRLVSGLLLLHLVEISIWAVAFAAFSVLPDFETSLYFSLTSYTTVGYGDVVPSHSWRLVGPIEAVVGVLMLGISTAFIVAAVQRFFQARREPPEIN